MLRLNPRVFLRASAQGGRWDKKLLGDRLDRQHGLGSTLCAVGIGESSRGKPSSKRV